MSRITKKKKPPGRKPAPPELLIAKKINKEFVQGKLTEMLRKPFGDLKNLLQDNDHLETIDIWLAKIIVMGITQGDHVRLNFMFDRLIGKVTEVKEVKVSQPFMIESLDGNKTITLGTDEVRET